MALFKCIQTGNVTEFILEHDIVQMKAHPGYEEVQEEVKPAVKTSKKTVASSEEV
jgi:hypothetical protein